MSRYGGPTSDDLDEQFKSLLSGMSVEQRFRLLIRAADIHRQHLIARRRKTIRKLSPEQRLERKRQRDRERKRKGKA